MAPRPGRGRPLPGRAAPRLRPVLMSCTRSPHAASGQHAINLTVSPPAALPAPSHSWRPVTAQSA